jgi:two-component system phosphate regulon sensor histidine kinase PhoR
VDIEGASEAGFVTLSVIDQGRGIAEEHIPRLTERFYRISVQESRSRGGTGLGLAIVKHILNRHRGRLLVSSKLGRGSTFTIRLPAFKI